MHLSKVHFPTGVSASRFFLYGTLAFALLLVFSGVATAQDVYRVNYFDNNHVPILPTVPEAFVHILNPGVVNPGQLCATIYVWRADQELNECCSCPITPNGLLTLPLFTLTDNRGDNVTLGPAFSGSIAIISDSKCDPTSPTPTPDLVSWATHVNFNTATGLYDVTETGFFDTPLSAGELAEATVRCGNIRVNGSGAGRCDHFKGDRTNTPGTKCWDAGS